MKIINGDDARNALAEGVLELTDTVGITMGPKGRTVLLQDAYGKAKVTKDGVSVANAISFEDPLKNMGAQMIKEVANNVVDLCGDGTTTASVLAGDIFRKGLKAVTGGYDPHEMKIGMDKAVKDVSRELGEMARPVNGNDDIKSVATISANGDTQISGVIADAFEKVGSDGIINVVEAKGAKDSLDMIIGMQYDKGYCSPQFVTDAVKMELVYHNPYILCHDLRVHDFEELVPAIEDAARDKRPLLIIAPEFSDQVISMLIMNKVQNNIDVACVKSPGYGACGIEELSDIAFVTGGEMISETQGRILSTVNRSDFGEAEKVVITRDETTIIGTNAKTQEEIDERVTVIKTMIEKEPEEFLIGRFKLRIARLTSGVANINVGGTSEAEMKERVDRFDDAIGATKSAVAEGIIKGGGSAFVTIFNNMDRKYRGLSDDAEKGYDIVVESLLAPITRIVENAGNNPGVVINNLRWGDDGYNAKTDSVEDLYESGIIDPVMIERVALENAVSVVGTILTSEAIVYKELPRG